MTNNSKYNFPNAQKVQIFEQTDTYIENNSNSSNNMTAASLSQASQSANTSLTLFYSYAHKDELLRDELNIHLKLLQHQGIIGAWYDRDITAGTDWAEAIDTHLNTADIILLLVSANFLASDYCYKKELSRALDRHTKGEARVIPIILKPCDWETAAFGKLQALPIAHSAGAKPVTTWNNPDEAFLAIAQGIRKAAEGMRKEKSANQKPDRQTHPNSDRSSPIHFQGDYIAGDKIQGDKIEGDKYDLDRVGNLNTGSVTIQGDQIGEQTS